MSISLAHLKDIPDIHAPPARDIIFERLRKAIVEAS
jgi:hypothetical protein